MLLGAVLTVLQPPKASLLAPSHKPGALLQKSHLCDSLRNP